MATLITPEKTLTLAQRRAFLQLPLEERRRQLAEQAENWLNLMNPSRQTKTVKRGKEATLLNPNSPKRGEIWRVNFDPTIGTEIRKTRPAIVISSDAVGRLPIKLVAPLTDWKDRYDFNIWHCPN